MLAVSPNTLVQVVLFIQTLLWGLFGFAVIGTVLYFLMFKFIVEVNKKTGSGLLVRRFRARRVKDKFGNYKLITMRRQVFFYPKDDTFIYKQGRSFVIRYYQRAEDDYHPLKIVENAESESKIEVIPQNIKFIFKTSREEIERKYQEKQDAMQKYGHYVGLGILIFAFVVAVYFMMDQVQNAIELGKSVVASAAQCHQIIT